MLENEKTSHEKVVPETVETLNSAVSGKKIKMKKTEPVPVTVMYLGPSIPNVVRYSTVFKDGTLPEPLKTCVEDKPYMKKLFVPLKEVPTAIKELNSGKSVLGAIRRRVESEFLKEGE